MTLRAWGEIGRILHFKTENRNCKLDSEMPIGLSNFGFRFSVLKCRIRPISISSGLRGMLGIFVISTIVVGQGLDPAQILKPLSDSWPTYSGDYSGKRYSTLNQIDQSNVKNLTLAWLARLSGGPANTGTIQTVIGGEGAGEYAAGTTIKGSVLQVDGILYVSAPDNAWAIDARDGHLIWHYFWRTKGGTHIGNRGLGMWRDRLFMETPDNYLVRSTQRPARNSGTSKSPTSTCSTSRRWLPLLSAITSWSEPATTSMSLDFFSRSIRKRASVNGSSIPSR